MPGKEDWGKRERKTTTTSEGTHTFHTSFQQEKAAVIRESPVGLSTPGAEQQAHIGAHQQRGQITLTHWTPHFI